MNRISQCGVTAALLALAGGHAGGVSAASSIDEPTTPVFLDAGNVAKQSIQCESVGDDVLANQTGKYTGSDMISGFVLSVLSQWQLPNGATAIAQGALAVAQNAAQQLTAQIETEAHVTPPTQSTTANTSTNPSTTASVNSGTTGSTTSGTNSSTNKSVTTLANNSPQTTGADPGAKVTGGQNVTVNGVSQITQVAGNGNTGNNSVTLDYSTSAPQLPVIAGATSQPTASAANASGSMVAGITFANNSINVAVQTPAGMATQSITPSSAQQAGAIAQLLQVAGNNQQAANQLALTLRVQQMSAAMIRQTGVLQALRNLH
jgi:hypothetical protein